MVGIYSIKNKINNKIYIGQSHDIESRWYHHKSDLRSNIHHNKHLQSAWNKYGEDNFDFSIIEECSISDLNNRETYWILKYDSLNNGYNNDLGGDGIRGFQHTSEQIDKMRRIQSPEIILQFDMNFNMINEWIGGSSHISKTLGYTKECILLRCDHRIKEMSPYKNYYWVYKNEYENKSFLWNDYLNNKSIYKPVKSTINNQKIIQYSKDKEFIKVWNSLSELRKAGFNTTSISTILHKRKDKKIYADSIWCYEDYDFSDGYFDVIKDYYNEGTEKRKRKVAKIDCVTLEILQIYDTLTQAGIDVGVDPACICVAAKNSKVKKSKGYYWEYINE